MKAAVLYGDEDIRYEDVPMPQVHAGEIKVHVRAAGICGSDVPRVFSLEHFTIPLFSAMNFPVRLWKWPTMCKT